MDQTQQTKVARPMGQCQRETLSKDETQLTTPPPEPQGTQTSPEYLESLGKGFIAAFNERNFAKMESYISVQDTARFIGNIAGRPAVFTFEDYVHEYRLMLEWNPNLQFRVIESSSNVDEQQGLADVFIYAEATGQRGGIRSQGVSNIQFRRKRGEKWLGTKHTILKGIHDVVI